MTPVSVPLSSYSETLPDSGATQGDLSVALNLVLEDGALRPVRQPGLVARGLDDGSRRYLFCHKVTAPAATHYLFTEGGGNTLYWASAASVDDGKNLEAVTPALWAGCPQIESITAIGNTIIVVTANGIRYYLWKPDEGTYVLLGDSMPEVAMIFGLDTWMVRAEGTAQNVQLWETDQICIPVSEFASDFDVVGNSISEREQLKARVTEQAMAAVNQLLQEQGTKKGRFTQPFLVRYALRLYDGSHTRLSPPVLMVPNTATPMCLIEKYNVGDSGGSDDAVTSFTCRAATPIAYLTMGMAGGQATMEALTAWGDVIKGVDIYVSAPLYLYDQAGKVERLCKDTGVSLSTANGTHTVGGGNIDAVHGWSYGNYHCDDPEDASWPTNTNHAKTMLSRMYYEEFGELPGAWVDLPVKEPESYAEEVRDCCNFYLLKRYSTEDLGGMLRTDSATGIQYFPQGRVSVEDDYLPSLTSRERLADDYDSHDTLIPSYVTAYNQRLVLAGLSKRLWSGPQAQSAFPLLDDDTDYSATSRPTYDCAVRVYIKQEGRNIVLQYPGKAKRFVGATGITAPANPFQYFFFPNVNAYKAEVFVDDYNECLVFEMPLQEHNLLNGAVYFGGLESTAHTRLGTDDASDSWNYEPTDDPVVALPNKIYLSEVANPFLFPLEQICTVGVGEIRGIATAARALSQGQFGQFPLYAFTTEGVWALTTTSKGTFSATQPITRDILLHSGALAQLDAEVAFATERGIMLLSGSSAECLTDSLWRSGTAPLSGLPYYGLSGLPVTTLADILPQLRMAYDYVHQRIIAFAPYDEQAHSHNALVYSLKSRAWGMVESRLEAPVNSYPNALVTDIEGNLLDFALDPDEPQTHCVALTRPLHLGEPGALKTLREVALRGDFDQQGAGLALWGSRDLRHWECLGSAKGAFLRRISGTPYKYLRIAAVADMQPSDSLTGLDMLVVVKYAAHLR